jgi:hypothetical protein
MSRIEAASLEEKRSFLSSIDGPQFLASPRPSASRKAPLEAFEVSVESKPAV